MPKKREAEIKSLALVNLSAALVKSIDDWATATTPPRLARAKDIIRDKRRIVGRFFITTGDKLPDGATPGDVQKFHQHLLDEGLSERYIYTCLVHLNGYFEWLRTLPAFADRLLNPVSGVLPKPPKKYNSEKSKSLSDEEIRRLWLHLEILAADGENRLAVRDYAIFRLFMASGMRREEIVNIGRTDLRIENGKILLHTRVKGGLYEWRAIDDRETVAAVERYLQLCRRDTLPTAPDRPLWIRLDRGARMAKHRQGEREERLTGHAFDKRMKKYAAAVGIERFHLHRLRHTFARLVAEESGSITDVQDALGHRDRQTTQIYVARIAIKRDRFSSIVRDKIQIVNEIK